MFKTFGMNPFSPQFKRTIPQIFIEDFHVGGYDELRTLENKGELDKLIK